MVVKRLSLSPKSISGGQHLAEESRDKRFCEQGHKHGRTEAQERLQRGTVDPALPDTAMGHKRSHGPYLQMLGNANTW